MELKGAYTALITPFLNREVDYEGYRKNVEYQLEQGISGLVPLGTTGETPALDREEQEKIIRITVEAAKGKVPILAGTGSNCTKHAVENTRMAKEMGADMALVVTPYYNKPTNEGLVRHFTAVAEVGLPIVVYNIAGRTGKNIDTPTLKRISEIRGVIGVKEASGDINQMGDVIKEIAFMKEGFSVMSGDDSMTLPLMSLGGKGVISVVSNLVPAKVSEMVKAAGEGDFARARALHFELMPLFRAAFIETNPIPIKEAMGMCGMAAGDYRLPMCRMMPENREKLKAVLQGMGLVSS